MTFFGFIARSYYWVTSNIESIFHSGKKKAISDMNKELKKMKTPTDIEKMYIILDFKWRSDKKLFRITLDHARKPWITYKEKQGDCEDFMLLSEWFLKRMGFKDIERYMLNGGEKGWHAVLLFRYKDKWVVGSNTRFVYFEDKEKAIEWFYGKYHKDSYQM